GAGISISWWRSSSMSSLRDPPLPLWERSPLPLRGSGRGEGLTAGRPEKSNGSMIAWFGGSPHLPTCGGPLPLPRLAEATLPLGQAELLFRRERGRGDVASARDGFTLWRQALEITCEGARTGQVLHRGGW